MGWTFNTLNPDADTNAHTIAAVGITFTSIALLTVLLRCYVRLVMVKKFGAGKCQDPRPDNPPLAAD
jgi:hypothetical protein